MAENTSTFTGAAADGTALTAVYLTQPAANVAIGLVFAGSDLPHIVHWGRPLAKPDTLLAASTHWLRHTAASHQLDAGVPLLVVSQNLRHSTIQTTRKYLHTEDDARHQASQLHGLRRPE